MYSLQCLALSAFTHAIVTCPSCKRCPCSVLLLWPQLTTVRNVLGKIGVEELQLLQGCRRFLVSMPEVASVRRHPAKIVSTGIVAKQVGTIIVVARKSASTASLMQKVLEVTTGLCLAQGPRKYAAFVKGSLDNPQRK